MNDRLPPIETDPLGAIRKELLTAAWRRKAIRDRRRRAATTLSTALVTLVVAVGGATAMGVNVPVIEDMLPSWVTGRQDVEQASRQPGGDPSLPLNIDDLKSGPDNSTEPFTFSVGETTAAAAAYLNTDDDVCFLVKYEGGSTGQGGCTPPSALSERLNEAAAYLVAVFTEPQIIAAGYVAPYVDHVEVDGPQGALEVHVSGAWTPNVAGATPLRAFVATARRDEATRSKLGSVIDPESYTISVRLKDGRTITVRQ